MSEEKTAGCERVTSGQWAGSWVRLFHATSSELVWMHWRWKQHRTLFGDKQSRIELLNGAAPFFFRMVHDVFFEDTLLAIARLVGPRESVDKPNLTIRRFPLLLGDLKLRDEVCGLVETAKKSAAFAIEWRNRRLAHRDLDLILKRNSQTLAPATRDQVEGSLLALRDVMNRIEVEYCNAATRYASPAPGDAEALLYVIRDGLLRDRERRERVKRGELLDEDIRPPGPL
jgi:AbiU2